MHPFLSCVRYFIVGTAFFASATLHAQDAAPVAVQPATQESVPPAQPAPAAATAPVVGPPADHAALDEGALRPECRWTGQRIASLLWRDDVNTALQHLQIYKTFGCSDEQLRLVFACLVRQGDFDPQGTPALAVRILSCWTNPGVTAGPGAP